VICLPHMIYAMNVQRLRFPLLVTSYLFVFCLFSSCREVETTPADTPHSTPERLRWWTDARFGMFIHCGPVTLTGDELSWSRANSNPQCPNKGLIPVEVYDSLYKKFNPADFKAGDWTSVAKTTGMKHIGLTTKHCDGFLLWTRKSTATTSWLLRSTGTSQGNWQ
jgi:hypothetical protein